MSLTLLNKQLEDNFGRLEDRARYRVVWSEDEFEQRHGTFRDFTREGIFLREVTEMRTVPKYRQWIQPPGYILERITPYEDFNHEGTLVGKLGYEPLHTFNKLGKENLPSFESCKYLIEVVLEGTKSPSTYVKYKDPDSAPTEERLAAHKAEIDKIMLELFGNETDVTDALAHKEGIVVPQNYGNVH